MNIQEACKCCKVLKDLDEKTMERLTSVGMLRTYQKDELIFRQQEEVTRIYFVISGYVALFRINHNQDKKIIFLYSGGNMINEVILEEPVASIGCQAIKEVCVLSFSRHQLLSIMEQDFELSRRILWSATRKIRRLYRQLANTANMVPLEQQVASKLWKLGRDFGVEKADGTQIDFDMTITFLADMVGAKRESVSRVVKKLGEQSIVSSQNRRVMIYDMEALKKVANREIH